MLSVTVSGGYLDPPAAEASALQVKSAIAGLLVNPVLS